MTLTLRPDTPHPTRRFRVNTNLITLALIIFGFTLSFGFELVDPVQWTPSDSYIVNSITPYNIKVRLLSPCEPLKTKDSKNKLYNWCNDIYLDSFINPIKTKCTNHELTREKRVIPVIAYAAIGVTVLAAAGGGIGVVIKKLC